VSRHRGRIGFRGGWALTYEEDRWWPSWESASRLHCVTWKLDGVVMTQAEYERAICVRPDPEYWVTAVAAGLAMVSGIMLSEAEAAAIRRGAHPLALLLPRTWARPLSLEEMMAQ
jgi:hypothetical protein